MMRENYGNKRGGSMSKEHNSIKLLAPENRGYFLNERKRCIKYCITELVHKQRNIDDTFVKARQNYGSIVATQALADIKGYFNE